MSSYGVLFMCVMTLLTQSSLSKHVEANLPAAFTHRTGGRASNAFALGSGDGYGLYNRYYGGSNAASAASAASAANSAAAAAAASAAAAGGASAAGGVAAARSAGYPLELGGFSGVGNGEMSVAGDIAAGGSALLSGSVPSTGAVSFQGSLPSSGTVFLTGNCGCANLV